MWNHSAHTHTHDIDTYQKAGIPINFGGLSHPSWGPRPWQVVQELAGEQLRNLALCATGLARAGKRPPKIILG